MEINFKQLTFAREYRGYSQTELAKNISGLSQSNLSKFEKGISTISDELLERIISFLDFPVGFFNKNISNAVENPHYRKRSTISKKVVTDIESRIKIVGYLVDQMTESIEWPDFNLNTLDIEEGYSVENIAKHTRKTLGLKPGEPVKNIFQLLEKHGILIVELDNVVEKFDGASIKSDDGTPIIIINKKFSNDRKRFTIAHELGHLIMHVLGGFPIPDHRDNKIREREADSFASEFLMPSSEIKKSLYGVKLSSLAELKRYWLTSMASILRRAYDLGCIDKDRYTYLNIEMSRQGLKKDEGLNVIIDSPTLFHSGYKMHKEDLEYSDSELSEAFSLPLDIINDFCNPKPTRGRMRVLV
ncbi:MAG: ImmA/IrrE family metallo-endopeptidase [Bacteroidales bacterium]|nr:ImmA/IrrE family metallo-endopeptidase [Bacteroidales bacterium]